MGLSDISAVEQIREESELSVRRIPSFKSVTRPNNRQHKLYASLCVSQAFLQTIRFYCWKSTKKYCRRCCSEHLPPTNIEHIYVPCIANVTASKVVRLHISILGIVSFTVLFLTTKAALYFDISYLGDKTLFFSVCMATAVMLFGHIKLMLSMSYNILNNRFISGKKRKI